MYSDIDFPETDSFLDFEGKERTFRYSVQDIGNRYSVRAIENRENGFQFQAISESTPYPALGDLRHKIRKRLSTRYLQAEEGRLHLYHDEAIGQISHEGVIIDGRYIPFEKFTSMLQEYEGFLIELRIKDLSDE